MHKSKGKTYEEIYGIEKARELKELRSKAWTGRKVSEDTKNKMSQAAKSRPSCWIGRKHSAETKEKISKTLREKFGSRQTVNKNVRDYYKVREWIREIFTRDNWTCQACGAHNGEGKAIILEAHHKIPLSQIIGTLSFEEAITLSELYDKNNGITLCRKCHMKLHGWKCNHE